jgi:ribulose-phosphate 3-epimerase
MSRKIQIVPAILTSNPSQMASMLALTRGFTDWAQIDLMDGYFVPSTSVSLDRLDQIPPGLRWEAHIMVLHPERLLAQICQAGGSRVIFHYEATEKPGYVIRKARKLGLEVGIALNPDTPSCLIAGLTDKIDCVLFMAVNPGFYGSTFVPSVLEKIKKFRQSNPDVLIGIDGGVKASNIRQVADSGVDFICVGSAIFASNDPALNFNYLNSLLND